jgi:hypothetical protein
MGNDPIKGRSSSHGNIKEWDYDDDNDNDDDNNNNNNIETPDFVDILLQ